MAEHKAAPENKAAKSAQELSPPPYKLIVNSDVVIRTADGLMIPNDPNNRDRMAYEAWAGVEGNVAAPPDLPPQPKIQPLGSAPTRNEPPPTPFDPPPMNKTHR